MTLVSIPFRYAENRGKRGDSGSAAGVSIPFRYAENRDKSGEI